VQQRSGLRRLSDDIVKGDGFATMLQRAGLQPVTTVTREPATEEVADALGVAMGDEFVVRARVLRTKGDPPIGLATSYFPTWVVEAAPASLILTRSGLWTAPRWPLAAPR
jgi:DNA-binding GntR family transcriptional regulator